MRFAKNVWIAVLLANVSVVAAEPELLEVVDLGVALKTVNWENTQGTIGPSPDGGHPIFYMSYYQTAGAELVAYDHRAKKVYRWDFPHGQGGYGMVTDADGMIYIGMVGGGNVFRFDPKTQTMRDLGKADQPSTYIWWLALSPDGRRIFGGGYPKCVALEYDVKAERMSSPGKIWAQEGVDYLRCVACDAKGRAWFGVGTRAALLVYDPSDGSVRNVLPERFASQSMVHHPVFSHGRMYVEISFLGKVLVFDGDSCELVAEIEPPEGEGSIYCAVADSQGNVYGNSHPCGHLCVIRPDATRAEIVAPYLGHVKLLLEDRYLLAIFDNSHRIYDLQTRKIIDQREWIEPKGGMNIMTTLTLGPQGKIYGSTYINQHAFCYDPATGKIEDSGRIIRAGGQCDSMCSSRDGKRLWMGCYAGGYLARFDPAGPHKLGTEPGCNPRDFGRLGKGQYRTRAVVEGPLGKVYCGSIPDYRSATSGAFSIFNPETLEKKVMTDFVPGGTVNCLAADDRFVYGSGGGKLFVLDPKTEERVLQQDLACQAMLSAADGTLVVAAGMEVRGLVPRTLEPRWKVALSQIEGLKGFRRLAQAPQGEIYGVNTSGIFRIDPARGKVVQLTNVASHQIVAGADGKLYFSRTANLYMVDPKSP